MAHRDCITYKEIEPDRLVTIILNKTAYNFDFSTLYYVQLATRSSVNDMEKQITTLAGLCMCSFTVIRSWEPLDSEERYLSVRISTILTVKDLIIELKKLVEEDVECDFCIGDRSLLSMDSDPVVSTIGSGPIIITRKAKDNPVCVINLGKIRPKSYWNIKGDRPVPVINIGKARPKLYWDIRCDTEGNRLVYVVSLAKTKVRLSKERITGHWNFWLWVKDYEPSKEYIDSLPYHYKFEGDIPDKLPDVPKVVSNTLDNWYFDNTHIHLTNVISPISLTLTETHNDVWDWINQYNSLPMSERSELKPPDKLMQYTTIRDLIKAYVTLPVPPPRIKDMYWRVTEDRFVELTVEPIRSQCPPDLFWHCIDKYNTSRESSMLPCKYKFGFPINIAITNGYELPPRTNILTKYNK